MTSKVNAILYLTALLGAGLIDGALVGLPSNEAVVNGSTVILRCEAASDGLARVMWTEFATNSAGAVISDNRDILQSHPNSDRYEIIGTEFEFSLQISDVLVADGARYLCQDINGAPPQTFRGSAELIVLASDPVCNEYTTLFGAVFEGQTYQSECEVTYQGFIPPSMNWTGPGDFDTQESITPTEVWKQMEFVAHRSIAGGSFDLLTYFTPPSGQPAEGAINAPTYEYNFVGSTIAVNWPPQNLSASPMKEFYVDGDNITCWADSNPEATYRWTNMRTLEQEPNGDVFTVTADLEGFDQVMRCTAAILVAGSLYTNDLFINVSVPAVTTPTVPTTAPTTTPPPADGPCNDLTGHWSSTNPTSHLCIEMDAKGNLLTLIRNGTDTFFVAGNGKVVRGDYQHVGFTGIWPPGTGGTAGFVGECHNCHGDEVILLSGLSRDKTQSPACGQTAGADLTRLYVLTRYGPPCRDLNANVFRPGPAHIETMGIRKENIIR